MYFEGFPDQSRVWIYTSDKSLDEVEAAINDDLTSFIKEWAAHGNQLFGSGKILHHRFVVLCVDESKIPASGCSIDTSVHFIKSLQQKYDLNLFDRMHMVIEKDGDQKLVHMSDLSEYADWQVYNPMVTTLGGMRTQWLIPVTASPFV